LFFEDVEAYGLEFAAPFAHWTAGFIKLGLRRFGEADRALQLVEEMAEMGAHQSHAVNARILRARLLLTTNEPERACQHLYGEIHDVSVFPSWRAEYSATRALAWACVGEIEKTLSDARTAELTSRAIEVRALVAAARAVAAAKTGSATDGLKMLVLADSLGCWDPVLCALRASSELAAVLADDTSSRPALERLYELGGDFALARRAGFRTRSTRSPQEVLSPRELEVLGLVARGFRNKEIAAALFIAESTAKVHVRHILEKLGVRTRAEAVAQVERLRRA
jgi:ATP/maltotriose-dependent transcriptional regulator MalT